MAKQMVATLTFRANVNGYSEQFTDGETIVDSDHPTVLEYPERFEAVRSTRPEVEEATSAPGEKRGEKAKSK